MKALRYLLVSLVIFVFSMIYPSVEASEVLNIDSNLISRLQDDFKSGRSPDQKKLNEKSSWNCKLFGMRSRLQTLEKPNFYNFSSQGAGLKNTGTQIVKNYELSSSGLKGTTGPLVEEVRQTPAGILIGEMSIISPSPNDAANTGSIRSIANLGKEVIAYSVCK
jgi:hypothetical protein